MDGVPLYTGDTGEIIWEMIPLTDIERIEFIKGPASSLYGSTAIGGVINIISKKPAPIPFTHIKTYVGVYDNPGYKTWVWSDRGRSFYEMSLTHSNSLKDFGYSFSFKKLYDDSYRKDDFKKRLLGYMKLNYDFSSSSSVTLLANYLHMNRGNFLYWKDSRNVLIQKDVDQNKRVESDRWFLSLIYKQDISKKVSAELKSSYYYSKFDGIGVEITSSKADLVRNELLINLGFSENLLLISGVELSFAKVKSNLFSSPNFYTAAGYAQTEFRGIDKLIATLGLRYDYIKLDTLLGANAYTPKLGLNYKFSKNLTLRASFGTGFRAPTPAEVFTTSDLGMGIEIKENLDLKAETSISFETGLIFSPTETFNLDVALFHTQYENFIEPTLTSEGDIQLVNLVEAKIQGLELISNISIIPNEMTVSTGYIYLWARDTKLNKSMKYRPRHTLYLNAEYKPFPFEFRFDFRYWSKIEEIDFQLVELGLVPDGELRVAVYLLDLRTGYNLMFGRYPLNIYLSIKNILNYNYVELIGNLRPLRSLSLGINFFL
jgi:iron complex outermembrane receptor protein